MIDDPYARARYLESEHPMTVYITGRDRIMLSQLVALAGTDRHDVIRELIRKAHKERFG